MNMFNNSIIAQFDRSTVDSAKGLLILCVILGHIRVLTDQFPQVFVWVNNFHVICFLLLPFLYDVRSFNKNSLDIWLGRYLLPFVLFATVYGIINHLVFGGEHFIYSWLNAIFIGTAEHIDNLTGMQSLWFIPTLFALVAILGAIKRFNIPVTLVAVVAVITHGLVGYLSEATRLNIPFGVVQVGYLFVLGLFLREFFSRVDVKNLQKYAVLFLIGWLATQLIATFYTETRVGFAMMRFQSFGDIGALLLHDVLILCVIGFLLTNVWLKESKFLCYVGKYSLQIYLFHHFIYGALYTILTKLGLTFDEGNAIIYGVVLYIAVLAICIVIIEIFKRIKIMPFLFPRSLSGLINREGSKV